MSELPIVKFGRKKYYFDARLKQLRNIKNPHDSIELTDAACMALSWKTKPQRSCESCGDCKEYLETRTATNACDVCPKNKPT